MFDSFKYFYTSLYKLNIYTFNIYILCIKLSWPQSLTLCCIDVLRLSMDNTYLLEKKTCTQLNWVHPIRFFFFECCNAFYILCFFLSFKNQDRATFNYFTLHCITWIQFEYCLLIDLYSHRSIFWWRNFFYFLIFSSLRRIFREGI